MGADWKHYSIIWGADEPSTCNLGGRLRYPFVAFVQAGHAQAVPAVNW